MLLCLVAISSCTNDKNAYINYFSDPNNGLSKSHTSANWVYKLQYRTPEYMALIEMEGENLDATTILDNYNGMDYFLLTIKSNAQHSNKLNTRVAEKLSFSYKNDIQKIVAQNSIHPELYHFENGLSAFGEYRCLFGFIKQNEVAQKLILREIDTDKEIEFNFSEEDISAIPNMSL